MTHDGIRRQLTRCKLADLRLTFALNDPRFRRWAFLRRDWWVLNQRLDALQVVIRQLEASL